MRALLVMGLALGLLGWTGSVHAQEGQPTAQKPSGATRHNQAAPRWPKRLAHRNARYAKLGRSHDRVGDERERFRLQLDVRRRHDRSGDHEEGARARLGHATAFAVLGREADRAGDRQQERLFGLTLARRFADRRRIRDLKGDMQVELARYRADLLRYGEPGPLSRDRVLQAERDRDLRGEERGVERAERQRENQAETKENRTDDRFEEGRGSPDARGRVLRPDPDIELRDELRELDDFERDSEDTFEDRREDAQADAELDRLEDADDRADERDAERAEDRAEDQVLQQEEDGGLTE